jgi:hypothetical protein
MVIHVHDEGSEMASGNSGGNHSLQAVAGLAQMIGTALYAARRKKQLNMFSKMDALAFGLVAVVFGPAIWWMADRSPPIELVEYSVFPPKVKPGETVYRVIKLNRLRRCEVEPQTILIDGGRVRWVFEDRTISIPGPLGPDEYKRPVVVPLQALPGPSELRTTTEFVCNPIHRIWPIKTENPVLKFEIMKHQ